MADYSDDFSEEITGKKKSDLPWLLGGAAVLVGVGYLFYKKQTAATQAAKGTIAAPAGPAGGTTTTGTVAAQPTTTTFNQYPAGSKTALWKILSMFPLTSSDNTYFTIGNAPATGSTPSAATSISQKDPALYTIINPQDGTMLFVDQGTAASQALFLLPGEWKDVAAAAAKDAANTTVNAAQLPVNLDPTIIQIYASSIAGA